MPSGAARAGPARRRSSTFTLRRPCFQRMVVPHDAGDAPRCRHVRGGSNPPRGRPPRYVHPARFPPDVQIGLTEGAESLPALRHSAAPSHAMNPRERSDPFYRFLGPVVGRERLRNETFPPLWCLHRLALPPCSDGGKICDRSRPTMAQDQRCRMRRPPRDSRCLCLATPHLPHPRVAPEAGRLPAVSRRP